MANFLSCLVSGRYSTDRHIVLAVLRTHRQRSVYLHRKRSLVLRYLFPLHFMTIFAFSASTSNDFVLTVAGTTVVYVGVHRCSHHRYEIHRLILPYQMILLKAQHCGTRAGILIL